MSLLLLFNSTTTAGDEDKFLVSADDHVGKPGVVVEASSETSASPAGNVRTPIVGERWRSTALDPVMTIDLGQDREIGILLLRFPRDVALPSGSVRHLLDPSAGTPGAGAALDTGSVSLDLADGYGYHAFVSMAPVTARYWRMEFAASGVSHLDIGRAWAAPYWRPEIGPAFGLSEAWTDFSSIVGNDRSGAEFVDVRARQRVMDWQLQAIREGERETARELARIAGISKQVVAIIRPATAPATETILGRLAAATPQVWARHGLDSKRFTIRESL